MDLCSVDRMFIFHGAASYKQVQSDPNQLSVGGCGYYGYGGFWMKKSLLHCSVLHMEFLGSWKSDFNAPPFPLLIASYIRILSEQSFSYSYKFACWILIWFTVAVPVSSNLLILFQFFLLLIVKSQLSSFRFLKVLDVLLACHLWCLFFWISWLKTVFQF